MKQLPAAIGFHDIGENAMEINSFSLPTFFKIKKISSLVEPTLPCQVFIWGRGCLLSNQWNIKLVWKQLLVFRDTMGIEMTKWSDLLPNY